MESRIRLILMILIMVVAILNMWFRNVDSSADNGNPERLRSEQLHNNTVCLEDQADGLEKCVCRPQCSLEVGRLVRGMKVILGLAQI